MHPNPPSTRPSLRATYTATGNKPSLMRRPVHVTCTCSAAAAATGHPRKTPGCLFYRLWARPCFLLNEVSVFSTDELPIYAHTAQESLRPSPSPTSRTRPGRPAEVAGMPPPLLPRHPRCFRRLDDSDGWRNRRHHCCPRGVAADHPPPPPSGRSLGHRRRGWRIPCLRSRAGPEKAKGAVGGVMTNKSPGARQAGKELRSPLLAG